MEKQDVPSEIKESTADRFKRVATKRTRRILNELRILGNCSNKSIYQYTDDDVDKIFSAIEDAAKLARARFKGDRKIDFKL